MLEDCAHACTVTNVKPLWPISPGRRERRVQSNVIGTGKLHGAFFSELDGRPFYAQR
jgi:hypothetical protein